MSFVRVEAESFAQAGSDIACLFGFGGLPPVSAATMYYLKSYAVLFLLGIVGATPVVRDLGLRIGSRKTGEVLELLMMAALLLVCTAYLVDGSFSPFLYFRF